jgi:glycosyltransferase involved in cell wall biosynthesis
MSFKIMKFFRLIKNWLEVLCYNILKPKPLGVSREYKLSIDDPIVVVGMFSTANGIGQSARLCAVGLEKNGRDVIRVDVSGFLDQSDHLENDAITSLPKFRRATMIVHLNPPELIIALRKLKYRRPSRWRVIGCWVFELEKTPVSWLKAIHLVSEIWTPSEFSRDALLTDKVCPVQVVPHAIDVPEQVLNKTTVEIKDRIDILVMADGRSSLERKGVETAIEIFRIAFHGNLDVRLVLKTRNISHSIQAENIQSAINSLPNAILIDESYDGASQWDLIASCDILLSAHRSEGFGLVLAEGMALGKCVVATGWSGNLEFMTSENSVLLPYSLSTVQDVDDIYNDPSLGLWAKVDTHQAAVILQGLANNSKRRKEIGDRAKRDIAEKLTSSNYIEALARYNF